MYMSKSSLLDKYYNRPLLYDLILNSLIIVIIYFLRHEYDMELDFDCESREIASLGITISGFILTILTILLRVC